MCSWVEFLDYRTLDYKSLIQLSCGSYTNSVSLKNMSCPIAVEFSAKEQDLGNGILAPDYNYGWSK